MHTYGVFIVIHLLSDVCHQYNIIIGIGTIVSPLTSNGLCMYIKLYERATAWNTRKEDKALDLPASTYPPPTRNNLAPRAS